MERPTWWDSLFKELLDTKFNNIDQRFEALNKALELQAREYERRLDDLNHAHQRALEVQHTFVSIEKYEDATEAEATARKIATERLDERIAFVNTTLDNKLDDYITRMEARQNELDQAIASQEGAAREAQRAAEEQGRKSEALAEKQYRKSNRNVAIGGIVVAIVVAVSNYIGA